MQSSAAAGPASGWPAVVELITRSARKVLEDPVFLTKPAADGSSESTAFPRPLIPHRSLPIEALSGEIVATARYSIVSRFKNKVTVVV